MSTARATSALATLIPIPMTPPFDGVALNLFALERFRERGCSLIWSPCTETPFAFDPLVR
jgi:hypothetical protein